MTPYECIFFTSSYFGKEKPVTYISTIVIARIINFQAYLMKGKHSPRYIFSEIFSAFDKMICLSLHPKRHQQKVYFIPF
jgi:hypothetical protein